MDKLKETWGQIRDLYAGMPVGTRIVAGLLVAVLLVSLIFLVMPGKGTPVAAKDVYLFGDYRFSQSQQNAAIEAFGKEGLNDYNWEGFRLKVPVKRMELYTSALSKGNAIPKDSNGILLETAEGMNALRTAADRNDIQFAAMQKVASQKIRDIPGVDEATVTGDSTYGWEKYKKVRIRRANASVRMQPNREVDKNMRAAIVGVVKDSLGIDDVKNITIIDATTSKPKTWQGSEEWFEGGDGGYNEKKREEEFAFEQKIRNFFSDISELKVTATAKLDNYKSWEQYEVGHGKPTGVATDAYSWKADGEGGPGGRRPGYEMQKVNTPLPNQDMILNGTLKYNEKESRDRELMALQGQENRRELAPFALQRISASVRIPYTYFLNTWRQTKIVRGEENPEPQPGEIDTWIAEEITRMKQQLFPHLRTSNEMNLEDAELEKLVTIEPYHTQEMEPLAEATAWQNFVMWVGDNWKTMSLFGLVAASLGVLWGVTRPQKPEPIIIYESPELPPMEQTVAEEAMEDDEEGGFNRTLEPFNKSMRSLQEEVSELVHENPDAAANVLRQWIGRAVPQEH